MSAAVVHQTLHGYSDGHRLISGSLALPSAEARTMLVMSDLSGPGLKPSPGGYLTGYFLEGVAKYVLGRTWLAPEMPRPGCVWTHSLIIDSADLASISSGDELLSLFQRPAQPSLRSAYSSPFTFDMTGVRPSLSQNHSSLRSRQILNAIYAAPDQMVLVQADNSDDDERLTIAIWMQQWPRLRRTFEFCTLAGGDRSGTGRSFDLQFTTVTNLQVRSKFSNAVTPEQIEFSRDLEPALTDLQRFPKSEFREFLRRTGGDVDGGRRAMVPLCRLYSSIFGGDYPDFSAAVVAFRDLDSDGRRQARSLRALVAREAVAVINQVDDVVLHFVIDTLDEDLVTSEKSDTSLKLGRALWERLPSRFVKLMSEDSPFGRVVLRSLTKMSVDELVEGLRENPQLAPEIAGKRTDLLRTAALWRIEAIDEELLHNVDDVEAAAVLPALLEAGRVKPAPLLIKRADPSKLAEALELSTVDKPTLAGWLRALGKNSNQTAGVLASQSIKRLSTLVALAQATEPDQIPNDFGVDPWLTAVRAATGQLTLQDSDYLAAFLMSRALGNRSKSQAELFQFTYTKVYRALQENRLPFDVERLFSSRLDLGSWFDWDKCARLRQTVVRRFVDLSLNASVFWRLTGDKKLAKALFIEAGSTSRGRRYLRQPHL